MSRRPAILCFAGDNYWYSNPHSRFHMMRALHRRGHRVLWVNSIGMNMPKLRQRGVLKRIAMKLRSWARWLGKADDGFWVLTPIALPLFGNRFLERINSFWIGAQVRLASSLLRLGRPVIFASIPSFADIAVRLPHQGLIYYYSDKYVAYRDIRALEAIQARDRLLFETADLVLCASRKIHEGLADRRPGVVYFPHAVDFEHFHGVMDRETRLPEDLADVPSPRIGYFGSLTDSNDLEVVRYCAEKDPGMHFVLIGRVLGDFSSISGFPNVHLLGMKSYEEIPLYGKYFDAAIMNWKMTEWIRNSNPVKTKEYLSLGLPVVSVPIEELRREYEGMVELAEDGPAFLAALRRVLAEDSPELRRRRMERVKGESWDVRVDEMLRALEEIQSAS